MPVEWETIFSFDNAREDERGRSRVNYNKQKLHFLTQFLSQLYLKCAYTRRFESSVCRQDMF